MKCPDYLPFKIIRNKWIYKKKCLKICCIYFVKEIISDSGSCKLKIILVWLLVWQPQYLASFMGQISLNFRYYKFSGPSAVTLVLLDSCWTNLLIMYVSPSNIFFSSNHCDCEKTQPFSFLHNTHLIIYNNCTSDQHTDVNILEYKTRKRLTRNLLQKKQKTTKTSVFLFLMWIYVVVYMSHQSIRFFWTWICKLQLRS